MGTKNDTYPRKIPTQERSRATVDAMVEAAARILRDEGFEAATTNRIAEVAGVSIGTLYQYFPSKEAIVAALAERELEDDLVFFEQKLAPLDGVPLDDLFERLVDETVARMSADPYLTLHRELLPLVPSLERLELVRARMERVYSELVARVEEQKHELALRLRGEGAAAASRREMAVRMATAFVESSLNNVKMGHQIETMTRPEFAADLKRVVAALLFEE